MEGVEKWKNRSVVKMGSWGWYLNDVDGLRAAT